MDASSVDALAAQIDKLLLTVDALEGQLIDADDDEAASALERRIERCYNLINQKKALLQNWRNEGSASPSTSVLHFYATRNLEFKYVHKLGIHLIVVIVGTGKCNWTQSSIGFMAGDTLYIETTNATFANILHRVKEAVSRHVDFVPLASLEPSPADPLADLKRAAERGDRKAQFKMGVTMDPTLGTDGETNAVAAATWYRKAARQGHIISQHNIGVCYENGLGVEKNEKEAVNWYRKAAEQGYANAQSKLGNCYQKGKGVERNDKEAVKWYLKAAEQGDARGQFKLGICYYQGWGVQKDQTEAVKWFRRAADQGFADAQNNLAACYLDGTGVVKDERESVKWYRKAADQGHVVAQIGLAVAYEFEKGVKKDEREVVKWYRLAAEQGHAVAQRNLARCFRDGIGVAKDEAEMVRWWKKSKEAEEGRIGDPNDP
ncbi:hypothetical protein HDV00_007095 [Rhizophlyctis rosea]|nr:hypothetical protein HDV00_007095 [Rhizophlyctis rosea]